MTDVFWRFRASKAFKGKADIVLRKLIAENKESVEQEKLNECIVAPNAHTSAADENDRACLVNEALGEDSHFDFPKIHLQSHWAEQIPRDRCLGPYSTNICKTSHNALEDAY